MYHIFIAIAIATSFGYIDISRMENSLKRQKLNKAKKKPIKIKYISSPMMVHAKNASEFRAIVQQLTGKNSDLYEDEFLFL